MTSFKTLGQADVGGKRVLVRADLNVPVKDGRVTDSTRIERFAQTVTDLLMRGAKVIVLSHFDRPKGKRVPEMSLRPIAPALAKAIGHDVVFADDCIGERAETVVEALKPGQVALLENLRYHSGEEANDRDFVKALAALGDIYVNDAFSAAHRAHASIAALAGLLPAYAGRLMQAELEALGNALENPKRPLVAVVGGAKVSTKLELLGNLSRRVNKLVIGGGMANTFLFAQGIEVGKSLCERDLAATARDIIETAKKNGCDIVLPVDAAVAREFKANAPHQIVPVDKVPADGMILDIGPATAAALGTLFAECRTVVWNGPVGAFELAPFDAGTNAVARIVAKLTQQGKLLSVAGGGDTVAALAHAGVQEQFSYVSTAGGAFLEWLEGKELPGVTALEKAAS